MGITEGMVLILLVGGDSGHRKGIIELELGITKISNPMRGNCQHHLYTLEYISENQSDGKYERVKPTASAGNPSLRLRRRFLSFFSPSVFFFPQKLIFPLGSFLLF
jgi:hypothetical protein